MEKKSKEKAFGVGEWEKGKRREGEVGKGSKESLEDKEVVPVPLRVDLGEVNAGGEDTAAASEEKHAGEGAPELVDDGAESEESEDVEWP